MLLLLRMDLWMDLWVRVSRWWWRGDLVRGIAGRGRGRGRGAAAAVVGRKVGVVAGALIVGAKVGVNAIVVIVVRLLLLLLLIITPWGGRAGLWGTAWGRRRRRQGGGKIRGIAGGRRGLKPLRVLVAFLLARMGVRVIKGGVPESCAHGSALLVRVHTVGRFVGLCPVMVGPLVSVWRLLMLRVHVGDKVRLALMVRHGPLDARGLLRPLRILL